MAISKRILFSFNCSQGEESQRARTRHLGLANEVLSGGQSQRGRHRAKKPKGKQPSDADLARSSTNTSDFSSFLSGPDLAYHVMLN